MRFLFVRVLSLGLIALAGVDFTHAQTEKEFSDVLRWRNIGPYRGGRVRAISGVPSQPTREF